MESLYAIKSNESFVRYTVDKLDDTIQTKKLTPKPNEFEYGGVANFEDRVIFYVGGLIGRKES